MNQKSKAIKSLLLGGILPIIAYTIIEEYFGTFYGLIAGMAFGLTEVALEWKANRKVETITLIGNGMILTLGVVSLLTKEGVWFKLQPGIIEAVMGVVLVGSVIMGKPFLLVMARKQNLLPQLNPNIEPILKPIFERGMTTLTIRLGVFFWIHAGLATWAALYASTRVWALLKGVGFTVTMILYILVETLFLRYRVGAAVKKV